MSKSYPRFTLLNLLVATTVIAMGFGTWLMGRQVAYLNKQTNPLKQRIGMLEYELGYPDVADPSRLHVNCSGSRNSGNYRYFQYRVHVPENCEAEIELALKGDADLKRIGLDKKSFAIPAGKHTVDFDVFRDVVGDGWEYNLTSLGVGGAVISRTNAAVVQGGWDSARHQPIRTSPRRHQGRRFF